MNSTEYVVINDGQFQYPVLKADLRPGDSPDTVRKMNHEDYASFCLAVPMDRSHGDAGTQTCIDFCILLVNQGADYWEIFPFPSP